MIPEALEVRYIFHKEHEHSLGLAYWAKTDSWESWRQCPKCDTESPGLAYSCTSYRCGAFIHKSCTGNPDAIETRLHHHPLTRDFCTGSRCSCCGSTYSYRSNFYKCSKCDFSLDQKCAFTVPFVPDQDPSGSCPSCRSAMVLIEKVAEDEEIFCVMCQESSGSGPVYNCPACKFSFHEFCYSNNWMQHQHPSHPFHPLVGTHGPHLFKCNICLETRNGISYRCDNCDFDLDFKCAFLVPRKEFEGKEPILNDIIHKHPLELTEESSGDCIVCYKPCTLSAYGCRGCLVNVHKACATAKIPIALHHNLSKFELRIGCGLFTCTACLKDRSGLYYYGYDGGSQFKLDMMCAYVGQPLVMFDGHSHPLIFLEDFDGQGKCDACGKPCSSSAIFRCPTCNFKLHLSCGPLPPSLKQETHLETLVLKDSHVEDWTGYEAGYEEIFCDSCEEKRDPYECVYYCARCNYSVEMKCVMPELKHVLTGKSGDVELRTLGRWGRRGKLLSGGLLSEEMQQYGTAPTASMDTKPRCFMSGITEDLTAYEKRELDAIFSSSEKLFEDLSGDGDGIQDLEEKFKRFARHLDSAQYGNVKEWSEASARCVLVGEYMVPEKLLHVYNDLHRKYGDVSAGTTLSPGQKTHLFLALCEAIEGICSTKVVDVTPEKLTDWCVSIKAVRTAGFNIQFAVDSLKVLVYAYVGFLFRVYVDEEVTSLEEEIAKDKAKLEELENELKHHKEYFELKEPSLIKDCIETASSEMYKTAGEVVLLYNRKQSREP